jgi:hypothetical protein
LFSGLPTIVRIDFQFASLVFGVLVACRIRFRGAIGRRRCYQMSILSVGSSRSQGSRSARIGRTFFEEGIREIVGRHPQVSRELGHQEDTYEFRSRSRASPPLLDGDDDYHNVEELSPARYLPAMSRSAEAPNTPLS